MRTSDKGIAALVAHEGIVPGPYLDSVGVWTYGVGHTSSAGVPDPRLMSRGMPADLDAGLREVFRVFRADLAKYEAAVARAVKVPVSQHEFDALVSFHFNTGAIGRAALVKSLNSGDRGGAAAGFMGWKKPAEIIPRRKAEQALFRDGVYPSGKATVWGINTAGKVLWKPARQLTQAQILEYLRPGDEPTPAPRPTAPPASADAFPLAVLIAGLAVLMAIFFIGGK